MTTASAPGKIILFGEHAVVYGRPAIAVPVRQVVATAEVTDIRDATSERIHLVAPDIQLDCWLHEISPDHPLARIIHLTLEEIGVRNFPALQLQLRSSIPISAGLGSGAAVSVAILRALSEHLGHPLTLERQSELAFEVEKIHHGTPSGIDNTVVTFDQPVYFVLGQEPKTFHLEAPLSFIIGDTGRASPTAMAVGSVRREWQKKHAYYEDKFDAIGRITDRARLAIEKNQIRQLGNLMDQNQILLEEIGVSSSELHLLIQAARAAGALGAKLSGAGMGGNMIALVEPDTAPMVENALQRAGAIHCLRTEIGA
jgi:mevalonate kinase